MRRRSGSARSVEGWTERVARACSWTGKIVQALRSLWARRECARGVPHASSSADVNSCVWGALRVENSKSKAVGQPLHTVGLAVVQPLYSRSSGRPTAVQSF
jgi:hypothetical protein